jgi:hypothetical protein
VISQETFSLKVCILLYANFHRFNQTELLQTMRIFTDLTKPSYCKQYEEATKKQEIILYEAALEKYRKEEEREKELNMH